MKPGKAVRVCVVGDSQVGKTSLITAAATESFPDNPPPVLPATRLSADATPEGVSLIITDTSSRPEDKPALEVACLNSDVIILVYDTGEEVIIASYSSASRCLRLKYRLFFARSVCSRPYVLQRLLIALFLLFCS